MARCATIERHTKETKIRLTLELDGTGKADIHTGIGFFDHMLNGFAPRGRRPALPHLSGRECLLP